MKFLRIEPSVYYNASFIKSIVEAPYLGMRKQLIVSIENRDIKFMMSAADFLRELDSDKTIIDLTAYYQH